MTGKGEPWHTKEEEEEEATIRQLFIITGSCSSMDISMNFW